MTGHRLHCPCRCFDPSDDPVPDLTAELSHLRGVLDEARAHCENAIRMYRSVSDNDSAGALSNVLAILDKANEGSGE